MKPHTLSKLTAIVSLVLASCTACAFTWQPIQVQGEGTMTWHKVCGSNGPAGTWQKLGNCQFVFTQTIAANTSNYNLKSAAIAAGWDQEVPLNATVTIASGVVFSSSSTSLPALTTGSGFPNGTTLALVNNGVVLGRGGEGGNGISWSGLCGTFIPATPGQPGGPALHAQAAITITNNGSIGGGGGGGGAGGTLSVVVPPQLYCMGYPQPAYAYSGGGGGAGGGAAGLGAITPGLSSNGGGDITTCSYGLGYKYSGYDAADGSLISNGLGGVAALTSTLDCGVAVSGGRGGNGGAIGAAGSTGASGSWSSTSPVPTTFSIGGAPGYAVIGFGNVSWKGAGYVIGPIQ